MVINTAVVLRASNSAYGSTWYSFTLLVTIRATAHCCWTHRQMWCLLTISCSLEHTHHMIIWLYSLYFSLYISSENKWISLHYGCPEGCHFDCWKVVTLTIIHNENFRWPFYGLHCIPRKNITENILHYLVPFYQSWGDWCLEYLDKATRNFLVSW